MSDSKIDLSNWVPKLLDIVSEFRPGSVPTAEQLNDYLNLLIEQGDYNSLFSDLFYNPSSHPLNR